LLESFRKGQRWLTLLFVATIGVVFVFFLGVGGSFGPGTPTGGAVVELDEIQLTSRDFTRERQFTENQLREQLGDAFDQAGAERYVDSQALSRMIDTLVLAEAARDLGLHVTTDEVRRLVQESSGFIDAEGLFDPAAFNNFAEREYGTQRAFIRSFTRSLLGQKLIQVLAAQTAVSDAEVDLWTHYELDQARIFYVAIDGSSAPASESLSEEAVEAWAVENEAQLRQTFGERAEFLSMPERVRARHLLVRLPSDADEAEEEDARARAQAARDRIDQGEDFALVAEALSEDVGTAGLGGDLGVFARGDNDPELESAAFSLEEGTLSELVRSAYGYHVLRVEERLPEEVATWDSARPSLAREEAERARAQTRVDELTDRLIEMVDAGGSLEEAARLEGLTVERPPALTRRPDGFVPGLGAAPDLLTAAFALAPGQSSPGVFEIQGRRVMIEVVGHDIAEPDAVAFQRADRREQVLIRKQNQAISTWLGDYRRQLESTGRLRVNAELALGSS
jgi:peptidyl-prolyl cis-trans isomerase D